MPEVLYQYRIHNDQASGQTELIKTKNREVQLAYLKAALPSLSQKAINDFPRKVWPVFCANLKNGFFDWKLLAKRLYKIRKNML